MKHIWKYIVGFFITMLIIIIFIYQKNIVKEYSSNLFYMDTYISVKIYSNDVNKAKQGLKKADEIFRKYQELTDRYNEVSELYLINHTVGDCLTIDKDLYELIKYAYDWYLKSNKLFNINMGGVVDVWKYYRELGNSIPTLDELKQQNINVDNIVLLDNNEIINNNANIDLGGIVKGYVTKLIGEEFKKVNIKDYIINAGGNVLVGQKRNDKDYKIGVESPLKDGSIYQVIKGKNISVVTSGSYERFYEFEGKKYHHIISPITLYPTEYMKSVTVICKDSAKADVLSTTLFLMPVEEGLEYLKQFNDVEAVWFTNNNEIIKTEGISKYE